jgi:hypothetical protein
MMVSPYCEKHDTAMRLLKHSHCERRHDDDCDAGAGGCGWYSGGTGGCGFVGVSTEVMSNEG